MPTSPFPVPTTLSGKPETSQPRPIQVVRLVNSEPAVEDTGARGRADTGTIKNISASPRLPVSPSPSNPVSASPPASFPIPSVLAKPTPDRLAIVPNSPPVSLASPVSEAAQSLPLNPENNQAAALGKTPVQVPLPNFARSTPAAIAPVGREKPPQVIPVPPPVVVANPPKVAPPIAPVGREKPPQVIPVPPPVVVANPPRVAPPIAPVVARQKLPDSAPNTDPKSSNLSASIEIPVPLPERPSVPVAPPPMAVPVVAKPPTPPAPETPAIPPPAPSTNPDRPDTVSLLPVPGPNVPIGNTGGQSRARANSSREQWDSSGPPAPPDQVNLASVRFRVLVEAEDDSQQAQVRTLVPDAFPTSSQGRNLMQVGAFGDREKANQLVQSLVTQGLKAMVEPMQR
ncbi:hypothetical protein K9N68_22590 [Kovacikia minuta CCNUW1]|uniref:hypothetical protein n=1 Tax=Kovacikia minuta TaxID=2931930 RepID=UPI001CC9A9BB|nr:hypothetical protein [Kovacikia minuta]UBF24462.1 hypothetical protein K9N68_22590 [Kovacikia minuta CCNUW1]